MYAAHNIYILKVIGACYTQQVLLKVIGVCKRSMLKVIRVCHIQYVYAELYMCMLQPICVTKSNRCMLKVLGVNYKIELNICHATVRFYPLCLVTFPYGVPGQVWYLIVSIPDLCLLLYFDYQSCFICAVRWP